jgi:hypothetical protein
VLLRDIEVGAVVHQVRGEKRLETSRFGPAGPSLLCNMDSIQGPSCWISRTTFAVQTTRADGNRSTMASNPMKWSG